MYAPAHSAPGTLLRMHCFAGEASGRPSPGREIGELAWFGLDEDTTACAPATLKVLRELRRARLL